MSIMCLLTAVHSQIATQIDTTSELIDETVTTRSAITVEHVVENRINNPITKPTSEQIGSTEMSRFSDFNVSTVSVLDLTLADNLTVQPSVAIDDMAQPIDDIPFVDIRRNINSHINTEFCAKKQLCNSSDDHKSCYCDRICGVLQDCCKDAENVRDVDLSREQFTCTYVPESSADHIQIMVVEKCALYWNNEPTKSLCEQSENLDDIFARVLVSDRTSTGFIYKNMYCAHCNNVYDFEFWRVNLSCQSMFGNISISDTSNCELLLEKPNNFIPYRKCESLYSSCSDDFNNTELAHNCTHGAFSKVYSVTKEIYRNQFCAECNGLVLNDLFCEENAEGVFRSAAHPPLYSFRMLVDFNSLWVLENNQQFRKPFQQCFENQFYDPFSQKCRDVQCPPNMTPHLGKCSRDPIGIETGTISNSSHLLSTEDPSNVLRSNESTTSSLLDLTTSSLLESTPYVNCTWTKLDSGEFIFDNNTHNIIFQGTVYTSSDYWKNASDVFVCMSVNDNARQVTLYPFNEIESYLSLIGLTVSIVALSVTLVIYACLPKLMNLPGKNLMGLVICLLIAQILYLVAFEVNHVPAACKTFAILMHFVFLSSFCWMNVIAFDLWMTFSQRFLAPRQDRKFQKRFCCYSAYAWGLPFIIVAISICVNFITEYGGKFRPGYGEGFCWITTNFGLLIFFAGPLALFKLFDFIAFGFTVYYIAVAKRQGALARKGRRTSLFLINLKLSLTMGLTWVFAFIANFTNNTVMWYLFIIFNTLQGLFIALSFLCTRKVLSLLKEKKRKISTATGTQMTSVSSNKS